MSAKIHAREFGKLAPYLRYKGCQPRERLVAVTREPRLFNQNIGGRQIERLCTAAEACPVLVSESRFQPDEGPVNGGGNYDPLKVPYASLNKNRPYAGNSEYPRVPIAVTISRCGQSAGKAGRKTGTLRDCTPGSDAQASDDDTVHAPWRHGEHVNKVSVGEPADGSPPKERHQNWRSWQGRKGLCFPIANV